MKPRQHKSPLVGIADRHARHVHDDDRVLREHVWHICAACCAARRT
jgi:hypothetical protein